MYTHGSNRGNNILISLILKQKSEYYTQLIMVKQKSEHYTQLIMVKLNIIHSFIGIFFIFKLT